MDDAREIDPADLDGACLDAGQMIWRAAVGRDRDLALRGALAARRVMLLSPEVGLLVRLPHGACETCGRRGPG